MGRALGPGVRHSSLLGLIGVVASIAAACGGSSGEEARPPTPPVDAAASRTNLAVELSDGTTIEYTLVLPNEFEPGGTYPVLLALPPGGQGQQEVDALLDRVWEDEARERGWIVVSPVAPDGALFFEGSERYVPEFLGIIEAAYPPEGGKFHLAGVSNGGLSAFRVVLNNPELFHSLLAAPGFPPTPGDAEKLDRLAGEIPVAMYVGENDTGWREQMEASQAELRRLGGEASLTVSSGDGHIIEGFGGEEYFEFLDSVR